MDELTCRVPQSLLKTSQKRPTKSKDASTIPTPYQTRITLNSRHTTHSRSFNRAPKTIKASANHPYNHKAPRCLTKTSHL